MIKNKDIWKSKCNKSFNWVFSNQFTDIFFIFPNFSICIKIFILLSLYDFSEKFKINRLVYSLKSYQF